MSIQEELLRRAKERALERRCTLGEVIEDALRQALSQRQPYRTAEPTRLATFRGRGVLPGVDLDRSADLLEVMEGR